MDKLTPKQAKFCEEYLIDLNGTQAAIRAGHSINSAKEQAVENLSKPLIKAKIQELQKLQQERTQIDADWVVDRLRKIADFDIRSVCVYDAVSGWQFKPLNDWDESAITTMTISGTDKDGRPKVKAESKVASLDSLAKHLGLYSDFNTAVACLKTYGIELKKGDNGQWIVNYEN